MAGKIHHQAALIYRADDGGPGIGYGGVGGAKIDLLGDSPRIQDWLMMSSESAGKSPAEIGVVGNKSGTRIPITHQGCLFVGQDF